MIACSTRLNVIVVAIGITSPRWGKRGMACQNRLGRKGRPPSTLSRYEPNNGPLPRRGIGNLSLLRRDIPAEMAARQSYIVNRAVRGDCRNQRSDFASLRRVYFKSLRMIPRQRRDIIKNCGR
ncbi:hypothetical protein DBV15_03983 [Temnothorax longispinosus]|uniref:Uncharacterized protein n=1 Tax=Temnothorax longispinosus TaxID=300112 RepID=A0A4S2L3X8_9HYME|nr:hypothetical protein DBV15_03983 [Temnothorax longispinosus]